MRDLFLYLTLFFWVLSVAFAYKKVWKERLPAKILLIFLILVVIVATIRVTLFYFLRTDNSLGSEIFGMLYFLLYPEYPITILLPIKSKMSFWIINVIVFVLGSLVWTLPLLVLFSRRSKESTTK
jgi:hypothetical protein